MFKGSLLVLANVTNLCSLRKSPKALAILREKLFLLWGDLEERKSLTSNALTEVSNNPQSPKKEETRKSKPFQCCLKEYGVKRRAHQTKHIGELESENDSAEEEDDWVWERRWKMFGTTII